MENHQLYVREHKSEGTRKTFAATPEELYDLAYETYMMSNLTTASREKDAVIARSTISECSWAFYAYPSDSPDRTDLEVVVASPWFTMEEKKKNEFQVLMGLSEKLAAKRGVASAPPVATPATNVVAAAKPEAPAGQRPIVAVFDVEVQGGAFDAKIVSGLSDFLAMRLVETGRFQVIPREDIKRRLTEQKTGTYDMCYDQSCQIELGKELAAEKTLATKISKMGDLCLTSMALFDLKKSTAESAATNSGACTQNELILGLEKLVNKLVGSP